MIGVNLSNVLAIQNVRHNHVKVVDDSSSSSSSVVLIIGEIKQH